MSDTEMRGKLALITGGSAGVGLSIALAMAKLGATVAVTGRNAERGETAAERLKEHSPASFFVRSEGNEYADIARGVAAAGERLGGLDMLVSAGAQGSLGPTPFADMTPEQLQSSFSSRFYPRVFPIHAALPLLRARGSGSVLMLTTDAARHPTPGESMIGAAGASVILLTKALGREFSRWSIRVNALALTLTSDTPSWDRIFGAQTFENKLFSKALERFPSGRAPTSDEVAEAAVFLVSHRASQITGQTLSVNGGLSFGGW